MRDSTQIVYRLYITRVCINVLYIQCRQSKPQRKSRKGEIAAYTMLNHLVQRTHLLFETESLRIEMLLQMLVRVVDTQLLERVLFEDFETYISGRQKGKRRKRVPRGYCIRKIDSCGKQTSGNSNSDEQYQTELLSKLFFACSCTMLVSCFFLRRLWGGETYTQYVRNTMCPPAKA